MAIPALSSFGLINSCLGRTGVVQTPKSKEREHSNPKRDAGIPERTQQFQRGCSNSNGDVAPPQEM